MDEYCPDWRPLASSRCCVSLTLRFRQQSTVLQNSLKNLRFHATANFRTPTWDVGLSVDPQCLPAAPGASPWKSLVTGHELSFRLHEGARSRPQSDAGKSSPLWAPIWARPQTLHAKAALLGRVHCQSMPCVYMPSVLRNCQEDDRNQWPRAERTTTTLHQSCYSKRDDWCQAFEHQGVEAGCRGEGNRASRQLHLEPSLGSTANRYTL